MREAITIQVGQCGNQVGHEFWNLIAAEHGISTDGSLLNSSSNGLSETPKSSEKTMNNGSRYFIDQSYASDCKEAFFYETIDEKFVPRAVLIDLEPRVITNFDVNFYNPNNQYFDKIGAGAGNNWAMGYSKAKDHLNPCMDIVRREAEASDSLDAFILTHSIAGGTGSGFGSLLLETLQECFPKKIVQTFSIFPNNLETSDVVVQPYNAMLTLQRLSLCTDNVLVIENGALCQINSKDNSNFTAINSLISKALGMATSTMRFPTPYLNNLRSLNSLLVPVDSLKLIVPSISPLHNSSIVRKTDAIDMLRKLLCPQNKLALCSDSKIKRTISVVNILSGIEVKDLQRGLLNVIDKGLLNFVEWMPPSYHCVPVNLDKRCGLALTNSNHVIDSIIRTTEHFDQLKKKNAFIEMYRKFSDDLVEFEECREVVQQLIDAYLAI